MTRDEALKKLRELGSPPTSVLAENPHALDEERCPNCQEKLEAIKCKAKCPHCGYFDDCSRGPV